MSDGDQAAEPPAEVTPENAEEILAKHGHGLPNYGLLPHAGALRDDLAASDICPTHAGNPDFDWKKIYASLDGEIDPPTTNAMDDVFARRAALKLASLVVGLVFDWMLEVNLKDARAVKAVGVRACAAAWVISPERFNGASLSTLAKRLGYRSQAAISPEAADFSRRFGITNHFQTHAPDKEVYEPPDASN